MALSFSPYLVQDAENVSQAPNKFRTSPLKSHLHMMGSGQFSESQLRFLLAHHPKPAVVFDLRQESHGFLNGSAISWYGKNNWSNLKRNELQIETNESRLLSLLRNQNTEIVYQTAPNKDPTEIHPSRVSNENQLLDQYGIDYIRIPVADHRRPSDLQVDYFVNVMKQMPQDKWVYFHCRGGKGRTTTFMAMVDMMKNAKELSFKDIIQRQQQWGGKDLTEKSTSKKLNQYAEERLVFLRKFYKYSQQNKDNFTTSWSEWLKHE